MQMLLSTLIPFVLFVMSILKPLTGVTPEKPALCHDPAAISSEPMAAFVADPLFAAAHPAPEAASFSAAGETVIFKSADGSDVKAVLFKAKKPSNRWLFVIHEWWGLNDWVKLEAGRFHEALGDVNVLALDMYDGKVAATPDSAGKLMQAMNQERGRAIIEAALKFAGKKAKVATVGWCFGGGWSLQASLIAGKQASGCIMNYGMPVNDVDKLKSLQTEVLFVLATQDRWITPAVAETFKENMAKAGRKLTVLSYDADHAFANPSNPKHKADLASDAFEKSIQFLKTALK
jgi:carboxymethylenebutenolidase